MIRKLLLVVAALSLLIPAAACAPVEEEEPIKIGCVLELTGELGHMGEMMLDGARMAVDEINAAGGVLGRQVELVEEDGGTNPDQGFDRVVESICGHLKKGTVSRIPAARRKPSPNEVVLIGQPMNPTVIERVEQFCRRHDLTLYGPGLLTESLSGTQETFAFAVASASLLVACLNNSQSDNLVHFAAGMVCARPTVGIAKSKMYRRVVLVVPDAEDPKSLIADSASRATRNVETITESAINSCLSAFGKSRERWQKRQTLDHADYGM